MHSPISPTEGKYIALTSFGQVRATKWLHGSPSWREHQIQMQSVQIMASKDRALPMTPGARSPRHVQAHANRLPPVPEYVPRVKSSAKKTKTTGEGVVVARVPLSPMRRLINWINRTVDAIVSGLLEQELEVQLVVLFFVVSGGVSVYEFLVALFEREEDRYDYGYASGHAPPAPPDFPGWQVTLKDAGMAWSLAHPIMYLLINFGSATVIGVIYLFWEDIKRWKRMRGLRKRGYGQLEEVKGGWQKLRDRILNAGKMSRIVKGWRKAITLTDYQSPRTQARGLVHPDGLPNPPLETAADMKRERLLEATIVEELEIKLKVHTAAESPDSAVLEESLLWHTRRKALLDGAHRNMVIAGAGDTGGGGDSGGGGGGGDGGGGGGSGGLASLMIVLKNSFTGFVAVFMFFADMASDVAVIVLLWKTGNFAWAISAVFFLVAQFVVMQFRVLPYMRNTFGVKSCLTKSFTYLGFPLGLLILDFLMLLEPFGLLAVLPLPAWLKQFVPACEHWAPGTGHWPWDTRALDT